jgi:Uma2 family endonuclease
MSLPLQQPRRKTKWTYEEYYLMASKGSFRDQHVEFIDGEIIEMPPQGEPHGVAIMLVTKEMNRIFARGHAVRVQLPLRTGANEEPEPDIAVVAGDVRDSLTSGRPRSAALIIEVSGTTLDFDLGEKAEIYAGATIEDYWVLDIESRLLHVHRRTLADAALARGRRYSEIRVLKADESIAPLAAPNQIIHIADLLP